MPLFHSGSKMSPAILFMVLAVALVVFISGLVLLVIKLLKKQSLSSILQSNRHLDMSSSNVFQRQLHQLFHVHDSGLDQALIDVLPMFIYKDIVGLSGPFDCPVCLCEFLHEDKLRLLPLCKHAFHLNCIDTWLLSNSTCPLCRGTLFNPGFSPENPAFDLDDSRIAEGFSVNTVSNVPKPAEPDEIVIENRVFSLRLGKFRHINEGGRDEDIELGETSNINLDTRRCFSMGSVQYVVADTEFQVALCPNRARGDDHELSIQKGTSGECNQNASNEGKKISNGSKRESFSISKVWLWPKKSKIPIERENQFSMPVNVSLQSTIQSTTGEPSVTIQSTTGEPSGEPSVTDTVLSLALTRNECPCDFSRQLNSSVSDENLDPKVCRCSSTSDEKSNLV